MIRKKLGEVITPTAVVLLQELERFNKLIKRMDVSLNNLQKVWQFVTEPLLGSAYFTLYDSKKYAVIKLNCTKLSECKA